MRRLYTHACVKCTGEAGVKVGDLIRLKRGYTSPPGLVMKVKSTSTGDWAWIAWLDEVSAWHNWRDLEVISETG